MATLPAEICRRLSGISPRHGSIPRKPGGKAARYAAYHAGSGKPGPGPAGLSTGLGAAMAPLPADKSHGLSGATPRYQESVPRRPWIIAPRWLPPRPAPESLPAKHLILPSVVFGPGGRARRGRSPDRTAAPDPASAAEPERKGAYNNPAVKVHALFKVSSPLRPVNSLRAGQLGSERPPPPSSGRACISRSS